MGLSLAAEEGGRKAGVGGDERPSGVVWCRGATPIDDKTIVNCNRDGGLVRKLDRGGGRVLTGARLEQAATKLPWWFEKNRT